MKTIKFLPLCAAAVITFTAASCNKEKPSGGDPPPSWRLTFLLTDSSGKHLLPTPLGANAPFNPKEFRAYSSRSESIGRWWEGRSQDTSQILFQATEKQDEIRNDPLYQSDSCFVWYFCFAGQCDTLIIYPGVLSSDYEQRSEKIIWGRDTIYDNRGTLRIYKKI